jgi:hypothetical protein
MHVSVSYILYTSSAHKPSRPFVMSDSEVLRDQVDSACGVPDAYA